MKIKFNKFEFNLYFHANTFLINEIKTNIKLVWFAIVLIIL